MSEQSQRIDQSNMKQQLDVIFPNPKQNVNNARIIETYKSLNLASLENASKLISPVASLSNSMIKQQGNSETIYDNNIDELDQHAQSEENLVEHQSNNKNCCQNLGQTLSVGQNVITSIQKIPVLKFEISQPKLDNQILHSLQSISIQGDSESIDQVMKRIIDIEKQIDTEEVEILINELTRLYNHLEQEIKRNFENQIPIQPQIILLIRVCVLFSQVYRQTGDFATAIKWLLKIRNKFTIFDPNVAGKLLLELGRLYFLNHSIQEAQATFYQALLHYEKYGWKADIANALLYQGRLQAWMKNYDQSKKLIYGALSLLKETFLYDNVYLAESYFILAECHYVSKDYEHAIEFLTQAIELKIEKYNQEDHISLLESYNLFGLIYAQIRDSQRSLNYFCLALKCLKRNSIQRAQIFSNIAVIKQIQGQLEQAEKCKSSALEIYFSLLHSQHSLIQRLVLNFTMQSSL